MPDWDEDSPQLRDNLREILRAIRDAARRRDLPTVQAARAWHLAVMKDLAAGPPGFAGGFRGEPPLADIEVFVGANQGIDSTQVSKALRIFEQELQTRVARLDHQWPGHVELDATGLDTVIELCAWAHAEWVRIHPFANGNGRTARLWANSLAMRYGLPPFVTLRPRPGSDYDAACEKAMQGEVKPTVKLFWQLLEGM